MTMTSQSLQKQIVARRILEIEPEDLPARIEALRRDRSLSKTVVELNRLLGDRESGVRRDARAALDHLGFL